MYAKTAREMMNKANIVLDFFEPVDCFKDEPAENEQSGKKNECKHGICFLLYSQ
jgi:hypothetical protein